jgi:hypothetical protein
VDLGMKSIPALKITFMRHGQLYSILGSYSIPGPIFPPLTRPKTPAKYCIVISHVVFRPYTVV